MSSNNFVASAMSGGKSSVQICCKDGSSLRFRINEPSAVSVSRSRVTTSSVGGSVDAISVLRAPPIESSAPTMPAKADTKLRGSMDVETLPPGCPDLTDDAFPRSAENEIAKILADSMGKSNLAQAAAWRA